MTSPDLGARLRAMFVEELDDQVRAANEHLLALEQTPADGEHLRSLFRVMHTLKGAARSAGVAPVERLCHRLESLLASARDEGRPLAREELDLLFRGADQLTAAKDALRSGRDVTTADVEGVRAQPSRENARPADTNAATPAVATPAVATPAVATPAATAAPATPTPMSEPPRENALRVTSERVDALFSISNRLLIAGARISADADSVEAVHDNAARAGGAWRRLRRVVAGAIAGTGVHNSADLALLDDALGELQRDASTLLGDTLQNSRDLNRIAGEVSLGVRELRMRPFADALADLPRVVRDVASATGKRVTLSTSGEDVQADRAVLAQIHDALIQLVRNAVDHGIETPAVRRSRGKSEEGTVRIAAALIGDRIVVTVQDDGAGLDVASMRRVLRERGEEIPELDGDVARRLFLGGISTRVVASDISGRGVGLDAVRAVAERVRGGVDVSWEPERGTTFTIEAPLTLATVRAVLARVGTARVAIPSAFVERLVRATPESLRTVEGRPAIETGDVPAVVASLAAILGPPIVDRAPEGVVQLVLVRVGERRAALRVDELIEEVEVVVRPIRAHGRIAVPHVSGAAMLASGAVALVLSAGAVVATALGLPGDMAAIGTPQTAAVARRRVLVVDDSITTRTLEASVLEAAGYDVATAVDGADGWRLLQERGADLVVSDVEMPRMDGLQLCEAIRASSRFRELPVILVTALETPEHRARGLEVGADAYLGKSSFEQEGLLTTVRDLLGQP